MIATVAALDELPALLLLGVIQGATEFLPVSSSGHLVLSREWLGLSAEDGLAREVALHLGTLVAVFVFCFADLRAMLSRGSGGLWRLLAGSSAVTAGLGLGLEDLVENELNTAWGAGCGLLVTTLLLVVVAPGTDDRQTRSLEGGTWRDAVLLGLFQSLALVPGISRAGATIVGALVLGFRRREAVRIAFLMSLPVVAGAVLLKNLGGDGPPPIARPAMIVAMGVACVVGLAALRFVAVRVDARSLRRFGLYTGILGVGALLTAALA